MNDNVKTAPLAVTVIDGDARQRCLARILSVGGDNVSLVSPACVGADTAASSDVVILPVHPDGAVLANICETPAARGGVVFAWLPTPEFVSAAEANGLTVADLSSDEDLTVGNALLTAEASLSIYMEETDASVFGSRVLVIGSGRVAECVCRVFSALGADVTVMARSRLAWSRLSRRRTVDINDAEARLRAFSSGCDLIINTVPARVIGKAELEAAASRRPKMILDLASEPFGFDADDARSLGLDARRAPGLPGKYAPEAAAQLIADVVRRRTGGGAS